MDLLKVKIPFSGEACRKRVDRIALSVKAILILFFLCTNNLYAQNKFPIEGRITDETGAGIPGANIIEKGTTNGSITDIDGQYKFNVSDPNVTIIVSFIGYTQQEISLNGRSQINVSMELDVSQLDEVVVVGYGEQKKVTVTGAVVAVGGSELVKSPAADLTNSLAGRLPGIVVIQRSGEPGEDGANISIRGSNTMGDNSPLIVIDGVPDRDGGIGRLSPQDVESISVLKDASAAIYGSRAANGVILVTTKRGKSGKPSVTYDFNQGWTQPVVVPKMANAGEYASIMNEIGVYGLPVAEWEAAWESIQSSGSFTSPSTNEIVNATYSPDAIQKHMDGSDPWRYPDTDWFSDAFKTWAPQSRHNLQIAGGSDAIRYMTSAGYVNQDAIYHNSATRYQQYSLRLNVDARINDYINTSIGVMGRQEKRRKPTEDASAIFRMLMRGRPTEPEVWPNGKPGPDIENGQNPYVITTNATGYEDNPTDYLQTNGTVNLTNPWIKGLRLTLSAAIDARNERNKRWQTPWELYYWDGDSIGTDGVPHLEPAVRSNFTDPRLTQSNEHGLNSNLTAMLNYDVTFGNSKLSLMVGTTRERFKTEYFQAFRRDYISSTVDQLSVGGATQTVNGYAFDRTRLGTYGRIQYNYKEKYMVEFIGRRDGSYIFPESDRYAFFPGILAGWNISNEDFFNVGFIDYLKVRASYGTMGNDKVAYRDRTGDGVDDPEEYAFLSLYSLGRYPIDGTVQTTLTENRLANPNFTWEVAKNTNIGIDATFLNGSIDLTVDAFINKRSDILLRSTGSTPLTSGIADILPPENFGEVENRGVDFMLAYNNTLGDLRYSIGINGGYAKNKVVFMDEVPGIPEYQKKEGKPIDAFLVYMSDGAFRDGEEIAANTIDYGAVTNDLRPGDMKFVDYNKDGVINADDQVRIDENATPRFNFGSSMNFQYKNFDLSILLQGATGSKIRVGTESGDIGNYLKHSYDNRWSIDHPSSEHPRLANRGDTYYTGGNFSDNTYFLFSKNYIRLKNIELGYTIPGKVLGKLGIDQVRPYISALNLITWDKNNIFDPENATGSGVYYPQQRVLNAGFRVQF